MGRTQSTLRAVSSLRLLSLHQWVGQWLQRWVEHQQNPSVLSTTWARVTCSAGRVTEIDLHDCGISGSLPSQWSSLTGLQRLSMFSNTLSGTVPLEWGRMTSLGYLYLYYNCLSGNLPPPWGNMTMIEQLFLFSNSLGGTLPPQWSGMINMQYLYLSSNSISGTLPPEWRSMTSIRSLYLHSNFLSGALPSSWGALSNTMNCSVHDNCLSTSNATSWWLSSSYRKISPQRTTECGSASRSTSISLPTITTSVNPIGTASVTSLCGAPPFSVNSSLRVVVTNNESSCQHTCPTLSLPDGGGSVTLTLAYDDIITAHALQLAFADDGIASQWLSLLPSVDLGPTALDVSTTTAPEGAVGLLALRPVSGWPGVDVRPYATQRLSLVISLQCHSVNGTVVRHPSDLLLVVTPRPFPVAASVQAVVQSSQGVAGGLGNGGGTEALTMGRIAMSLSMLSCNDALQGSGAGLGVVSISDNLLMAVDTIAGNAVFVMGAAAAAVLAACGLFLLPLRASHCSFAECCRDVLRLPLSLFPVMAATLPSTTTAVGAILRDAHTLSGSTALTAYVSIACAVAVWGAALTLAGRATHRMATAATLRPAGIVSNSVGGGCGLVRRAFRSSTEWVAPLCDVALFEGTTVLWFLPLDVCTTVAMAAVCALPLSRSAAVCLASNTMNVTGCAVMFAVAVVRRPFSTAFARVHSIVTYLMAMGLAICGLALTRSSGESHDKLLVAISYLSGATAAMSAVKTAVHV